MPFEEEYRFKASLDLSELYSQLATARSEINSQLSAAFQDAGQSSQNVLKSVSGAGAMAMPSAGGMAVPQWTQGVMSGAGGLISDVANMLPTYRAGERAAGMMAATGLPAPFGMGSDPVYQARLAAREHSFQRIFLPTELISTGASLGGFAAGTMAAAGVGAAVGTAIGGPVGTVVGGAIGIGAGIVGSIAAEGIVRPVAETLVDTARWSDYMYGRNALEHTLRFGLGNVGLDASGVLDPEVSSVQALGFMRRAERSRMFNTRDLATIAGTAAQTGMLTGITSGVTDIAGLNENLGARLEEIERRVARVRTQLGTDTAGALGQIVRGVEMGFSEAEAEAFAVRQGSLAFASGVRSDVARAVVGSVSDMFRASGLQGTAGALAGETSLLHARGLVDQGAIERGVVMRMGGVAGLAQEDARQTARFLSSGTGGLVLRAGLSDPAMLRKFVLEGGMTANDFIGEVRANMPTDPMERISMIADTMRSPEKVNPLILGAMPERTHLETMKQKLGRDKFTQKQLEDYLMVNEGMTPDQAAAMAGSMKELQDDPTAMIERADALREEQLRRSNINAGLESQRQFLHESRVRTLKTMKNFGLDAVFNMAGAWTGSTTLAGLGSSEGRLALATKLGITPGQEVAYEKRRADQAKDTLSALSTAFGQQDPSMRGEEIERVLDEAAARRIKDVEETQGVIGALQGKWMRFTDKIYDKMDTLPFVAEWAMEKRTGLTLRAEEKAAEEASGYPALSEEQMSDPSMVLLSIDRTLRGILAEVSR